MEEGDDLSFIRVKTMAGIKAHYCFWFYNGNVVVMYKLAKDEENSQVFRVADTTGVDGEKKVFKVDPKDFV